MFAASVWLPVDLFAFFSSPNKIYKILLKSYEAKENKNSHNLLKKENFIFIILQAKKKCVFQGLYGTAFSRAITTLLKSRGHIS